VHQRAPFGPSSPKTSPAVISNERLSSATTCGDGNTFRKPCARMPTLIAVRECFRRRPGAACSQLDMEVLALTLTTFVRERLYSRSSKCRGQG
jgi:hypothetical protein